MIFKDPAQFRIESSLPFLKIYVHMQGQFMRKIGKELAGYTANDAANYCSFLPSFPPKESEKLTCYGTRISFDVSQITLLKSRHDAENACNPDLNDEDMEIMKTLVQDKILGCRPLYWKGLEAVGSMDECTELLQYKHISETLNNFTSYEKIRKRFTPPCKEMIIETNIQSRKGRKLKQKKFDRDQVSEEHETGLYLDLQFRYVNDRYQVIENSRGFTMESCWAGIGGFIGIFIGLSLMQVPEILYQFFNFIKSHKP